MTLAEILNDLEAIDDDMTIYADKNPIWSASSRTIVCLEDDVEQLHDGAGSLSYLLEVHLAKDAVQGWSDERDGRTPTTTDKCEAVIYYAENDTYLPA